MTGPSQLTACWKDVRCASIPVDELAGLADLRGQPGILVSIDRGRAWICWDSDSDQTREMLVRRILPTPGAELFTRRGGLWYRLGEHLPAFDVPLSDGASGVPLHRIVLPLAVKARRPAGDRGEPPAIRLVRDQGGVRRPTTAVRSSLHVLSSWADRATSGQLAELQAVCAAGPDGLTSDSPVLVVGPPDRLPFLPGGSRYWGTDLLLPLGFRVDPELPEPAVRRAAGADAASVVLCEHDGFELIPRGLFRPDSRAAIRLACGFSGVTSPEGPATRGEGGGR
jgi:hypothetical protein